MTEILKNTKNLADPNNFTLYKAFESGLSGPIMVDQEACFITDYISVIPGDHIYVTYLPMNIGSPYQGYVARSIALFDKDKKLIKLMEEPTYSYVIPKQVSFIRITGYLNAKDCFTVTKNYYNPLYIPYGEKINNDLFYTDKRHKSAAQYKSGTLAANTLVKLEDFPSFIKKNRVLTFSTNIKDFNNDDEIHIGFSTAYLGSAPEGAYGGYRNFWIGITSSFINFYVVKETDSRIFKFKAVLHNLDIQKFIKVVIEEDDSEHLSILVDTLSGSFSIIIPIGTCVSTSPLVYFLEMYGVPFIKSSCDLQQVIFSAVSKDLQSKMWLFGDSYFGLSDNRVIGQLFKMGFGKTCLVDGFAGGQSPDLFKDFVKCLEYNTPKYLVWYLGMNDKWQGYNDTLIKLKRICGEKNITLILNEVPYVPNNAHPDAAIITNVVRGEAYIRSIHSWNAVIDSSTIYGDNGKYYSGQWYPGFLDVDNLHPTKKGAETLALQLIADVPEILSY